MYNIWLCRVLYGDMKESTDNYSLEYIKVLYESIEQQELQEYVENICIMYQYGKGHSFGCDNQCLALLNVDESDNYCLFFEEMVDDDEQQIKRFN